MKTNLILFSLPLLFVFSQSNWEAAITTAGSGNWTSASPNRAWIAVIDPFSTDEIPIAEGRLANKFQHVLMNASSTAEGIFNNSDYIILGAEAFTLESSGTPKINKSERIDGDGNGKSPEGNSSIESNPVGNGIINYRLKQTDTDGKFEFSNAVQVVPNAPEKFSLYQNYPNPFNPSTNIKYAISARRHVTLRVYNVLGNEVATLVNEEKEPGIYEIEFSSVESLHPDKSGHVAPSLPGGIYFYQLRIGQYIETKKMILLI